MDKAYHVGRWSILAVSVGEIQNPARVAEAILTMDVTLGYFPHGSVFPERTGPSGRQVEGIECTRHRPNPRDPF